jgi:hypothetical protein
MEGQVRRSPREASGRTKRFVMGDSVRPTKVVCEDQHQGITSKEHGGLSKDISLVFY